MSEPVIRVETFADVKEALTEVANFDLYILDGAPHSSRDTQVASRQADLIVLPTGQSLDDLEPSVLLAHDLFKDGVAIDRIVFALCRVSDSEKEVQGAKDYLGATPYRVAPRRSAIDHVTIP